MNASVTGGCAIAYGGVTGIAMNPTINTPTTFTGYYKANSTTNLTLTPVTTARFVITSITIEPITTATGRSTVYGDSFLAGRLLNPSGTLGLQIDPSGTIRMGGALVIAGALSGATTGAFSSTITLTRTSLAATSTDGYIQTNTTAATSGTPVQISPRARWSGTVWDTGSVSSKTVNFIQECLPISGNPGTANLNWSYDYNAGGYSNIMTLTSAGALSLVGVAVPTISSTNTLTNKRITKRTGTTTSSATPTINTDNVDFYSLTAQTVDITSFTTNLSGTPTEGQELWIAITGTAARAITWGTSFEASTVALPTTTVTTNRLDVKFVWNTVTSKWRCVQTF
jgi:hypothetical protein